MGYLYSWFVLLLGLTTQPRSKPKKVAGQREKTMKEIARSALGQVSSPLFPKKNYKGLENVSYSVN